MASHFFISTQKQSKGDISALALLVSASSTTQQVHKALNRAIPQYTAWLEALQLPACTGTIGQFEKQLSTSELVSS
jgi:hypothetical protein